MDTISLRGRKIVIKNESENKNILDMSTAHHLNFIHDDPVPFHKNEWAAWPFNIGIDDVFASWTLRRRTRDVDVRP